MSNETQFADGLRAYKPSPQAPDFIKANLEVDVTVFTKFLEAHATDKGTVRIVIKESRGGKYYAQLDQFTSGPKQVDTPKDAATDPDDVPF